MRKYRTEEAVSLVVHYPIISDSFLFLICTNVTPASCRILACMTNTHLGFLENIKIYNLYRINLAKEHRDKTTKKKFHTL